MASAQGRPSAPNIWSPGETLSRWQWPRQVRPEPAWPPRPTPRGPGSLSPCSRPAPGCRAHPACGLDAFGPQPRPQEAIHGFYFYLRSPSQGRRTCPLPRPCAASTSTPRLQGGQSFLISVLALGTPRPQQERRGVRAAWGLWSVRPSPLLVPGAWVVARARAGGGGLGTCSLGPVWRHLSELSLTPHTWSPAPCQGHRHWPGRSCL